MMTAEVVSIHVTALSERMTRAVAVIVELLERVDTVADAPEIERARQELDAVERIQWALTEEFAREHPNGWPDGSVAT